MRFYVSILLIFSTFCTLAQKKIYVNINATSSNQDGKAWASAYQDLANALNQASYGDSVFVAQGTYFPTQTTDRSKNFMLKNGVKLFGGFSGTEKTFSGRDWSMFPTILDGNIGAKNDSLDNSYNVVYMLNPDSTTILDGFDIQHGSSTMDFLTMFDNRNSGGGAVLVRSEDSTKIASPVFNNCRFIKNAALYSASAIGFQTKYMNLIFNNCDFIKNRTRAQTYDTNVGFLRNTKVYCEKISIQNCKFSEALDIAFYAMEDDVDLINCHLTKLLRLRVTSLTLSNQSRRINVENCSFKEPWGIGSSTTGKLTINIDRVKFEYRDNSYFHLTSSDSVSIAVKNSTFIKGRNYYGGGTGKIPKTPTYYINCNFIDTIEMGYIYRPIVFRNCIFKVAQTKFEQVFNPLLFDSKITIRFENCLFNIPKPSKKYSNITFVNTAFNAKISFVDSLNDFHLQPCSDGINKGSNDIANFNMFSDFEGKPRVMYDSIDIGAYEFRDFKAQVKNIAQPKCVNDKGAFSVELDGFCGTPSILWSGNGQKGTNTSIPSGDYTVLVTDKNGAYVNFPITINKPTEISYSSEIQVNSNNSGGAILLYNIVGGTPPYNFMWSNGAKTENLEKIPVGFYTVTVTDSNGCTKIEEFKVGTPIATKETQNDINFSIFPNPSNGQLTLQYKSENTEGIVWELYNSVGILIYQKTIQSTNNQENINIGYLLDGMYFWHLKSKEKILQSGKLLLIK
jgi:predicted secreted protein